MEREELEEGEVEVSEVEVAFKPPLPPRPPPPPRPISPPPVLVVPTVETPSNDVLTKPIKRREVLEEEEGIEQRDGRDSTDEPDVYSNFSPNRNSKDYEKEARTELISFLQKKSLDASWADYYSIHTRPQKKRKDPNRKSEGPGYSATYANPEGTFLASKSDVLSDIQDRMRKSNSRNSLGNSSARITAFEEAQHKVKNLDLPLWLDNIFLLDLGKVDTRSGFHSSVYIYPIGYKCEQLVTGTTLHKGFTDYDVICEIGELDGFPEFRITIKATGTVLCGFSEAAVWRKFNPGNVDADWNPSFFNLQVELLIEGLDGSLQCEEYKYHQERGYGQTYFSEEAAKIARKEFLTKAARERRNQDRQKNKHLTKEQQERQLELQRRTAEEEKEFSKKLKVVEREIKDRSKEDLQKKKEEKKVNEAKRREEVKQQELQSKEKLRTQEKQYREQLKKNEKMKQQLRKEIIGDIRKNRSESNSSVLQFFDNEEENISNSDDTTLLLNAAETNKLENGSFQSMYSDMKEFIQSIETLPEIPIGNQDQGENTKSKLPLSPGYYSGLSWDDIFYIANSLFLLKPMLGLGRGINFDEFLTGLHLASLVNGKSDVRKVHDELADNSAMEVDGSVFENNQDEEKLAKKAFVELERIELSITKILLRDLSTLFDLDQRDAADKRQAIPQTLYFPLNQLTWIELARMALLGYVYSQFDRTKEDIQHALRGSKQPSYRIGKNIIRNIRYRWYLRRKLQLKQPSRINSAEFITSSEYSPVYNLCPEDRLSTLQAIHSQEPSFDYQFQRAFDEVNRERKQSRPLLNIFNSEEEMEDELKKMANNEVAVPEIYRRCCKVMLRILSINSAKNFLWEIDQEMYPDYYSIMIRPLMFANVATNLITKAYDSSFSATESTRSKEEEYYYIASEYFHDLRQVCLNCIVFSTELPLVVAQAQKLLLTIQRLIDRWVFSSQRPEISNCDENYCLLTNYPLQANNRGEVIKCGKCQCVFSLTGLDEILTSYAPATPANFSLKAIKKQYEDYYIAPTTEIINQVNEEWHCPLCLREDFVFAQTQYSSSQAGDQEQTKWIDSLLFPSNGQHYIDEWGPSGLIPWYFNSNHCNAIHDMFTKQPHLLPVIDALKILTQAKISPDSSDVPTFSIAEKIKLLSALCTVINASNKATNYTNQLHTDCEKLLKLCSNKQFREGDFYSAVKSICGEEDAIYCRNRLDGIINHGGSGESAESLLQQLVTEGRCIVCNASTFEEEMAGEDGEEVEEEGNSGKRNAILLCDGCNAEVHLKCLNLTAVPSSAWYCKSCSERQAKINKSEIVTNTFENIDNYRDKEEEDQLIDFCATEKISGKDPFQANQVEPQCIYCGMNEREVCSPLVIGQTRSEHDAWIEMHGKERQLTADNFHRGQKNTIVTFLYAEKTINPPKLTPPYFPPIGSAQAKSLTSYYEAIHQTPIVAHQLCSLQLFQARLNRSRHALRRRRKAVASIAFFKSGISIQSLGRDHAGYEYWKFPFSLDLFIAEYENPSEINQSNRIYDSDREEFNRLIGKVSNSLPPTSSSSAMSLPNSSKNWRQVRSLDGIRTVVELLNDTYESERLLKQNICQFLLNERVAYESKASEVEGKDPNNSNTVIEAVEGKESNEPTNEQAEANNNFSLEGSSKTRKSLDNIPVGIKLFTNKGSEVFPHYVIPEEMVFDDSLPTSEEGNEGNSGAEDLSYQYFEFNTKKFFAVGLINQQQNLIKVGKLKNQTENYKLVYQIHREGITQPISYAVLSEPWEDHYYYFSTINFKKSGKYTISFLLEGASGGSNNNNNSGNGNPSTAGSIKPLIYSVTVEAKSIKSGLSSAFDHLQANQYVDGTNRQILTSKRDLNQYLRTLQANLTPTSLINNFPNDYSMLIGLKILLIKIFLALPQGSLSSETHLSSLPYEEASEELLASYLLEPNTWNYLLEQAWKTALVNASCPTSLMECVLLLEFYLNRGWFSSYHSRLLNALPNPHFAIRSVTYSAVALRVYCLDRAILYDKVQLAPRDKRNNPNTASSNSLTDFYYEAKETGRVVKEDRSKRYNYRQSGKEERPPVNLQTGRSQRSAAVAASAKLKDVSFDTYLDEEGSSSNRLKRQASEDFSQVDDQEEEEEEENEDEQEASNSDEDDDQDDDDDSKLVDEDDDDDVGKVSNRMQGWKCTFCGTKNEARARSCDSCLEKKQVIPRSASGRKARAGTKKRKSSRKPGRGRKRRRTSRGRRPQDSDESDEEESGEEEDNEEDSDENDYGKARPSRRSSSRGYTRSTAQKKPYTEDSEEEAEEEVEGESDEEEDYKYHKRSKAKREEEEEEEEEPEEEEEEEAGEEEEDEEVEDKDNNKQHEEFVEKKLQEIHEKIQFWKSSSTASTAMDSNIRYLSILRNFLKDLRTEEFWRPVNVPDYSNFIKEPMDLGTMLQKVLDNRYEGQLEKFRYDMNLVWSNCMTYNLEYSELYSLAEEALNTSEELIQAWVESSDRPVDPDIEETL